MKKILKTLILTIITLFNIISGLSYINAADNDSSSVIRNQNDDTYEDLCIFGDESGAPEKGRCTLDRGIIKIKDNVDGIEKKKGTLEYAQEIISYLLGFVYILAVIYIIYAGFLLLMGTGDIIASGKARSNIIYVLVGVTIIYLANSIITWLIGILG